MNAISLKDPLTCLLLPAKGQFCESSYLKMYEQSFSFWLENVQNALLEENNHEIASNLSSDGFLDCDESAILYKNQNPVGIFMFRWIDLNIRANQLLSGIKDRFPQDLLFTLQNQKIKKIMTMGNLVVDPDHRRNKIGFGISDILMGFALKRFLESDAEVLLTTTRNNRSTNTLCYRQGGKKFSDNKETFGVSSDVVIFYRHDVKPHPEAYINALIENLWQNKAIGWKGNSIDFIGRKNEKTIKTT